MRGTTPGILVLGLGNVLHEDDGAGVEAVRRLRESPDLPEGVRCVEGGTLGLELLPYLQDASHVLLLDAVDVDARPGTVVRMLAEEIYNLPRPWSVHQLGLPDMLEAVQLTTHHLRTEILLGVQPERTGWGVGLSAPVDRAIEPMVQAALEVLRGWSLSKRLPQQLIKLRKRNAGRLRPFNPALAVRPQ